MTGPRIPGVPRSHQTHGGLGFESTTAFPGGHRALEPPDPIPNSEVKRCIADDSVGLPHAKVGHRQGLIPENPTAHWAWGFFWFASTYSDRVSFARCGWRPV
jgi:hypothetical protein